MRSITSKGLDLIKRFEGFSSTVYICPAGHPTIGYGHLITEDENFNAGISESEAEALLRQDVYIAERGVLKLINVPLFDPQFDALVSFTFNLGVGALQRSTLRRVVNREDHDAVPYQLSRWVYAGGQKLKGLIHRRHAESFLYQLSVMQ